MAVVRHPRLPEVTQEVDDPRPWIKQGWVPEDAPAPKAPARPRARRNSARKPTQ